MTTYTVRFVHKIAPGVGGETSTKDLPDGSFSNRNTLSAALRKVGVLPHGGRLINFRVEGDKVIAFPASSIWHSIILTVQS